MATTAVLNCAGCMLRLVLEWLMPKECMAVNPKYQSTNISRMVPNNHLHGLSVLNYHDFQGCRYLGPWRMLSHVVEEGKPMSDRRLMGLATSARGLGFSARKGQRT